eukprot:159298_1
MTSFSAVDPMLRLFLTTRTVDHKPRGKGKEISKEKYGNLLVFQRTDSISDVFQALGSQGFLGAPVLDGDKYIGFVDMMQLVRFVTQCFWGRSPDEWEAIWKNDLKFKETQVDEVLPKPGDRIGSSMSKAPFVTVGSKRRMAPETLTFGVTKGLRLVREPFPTIPSDFTFLS